MSSCTLGVVGPSGKRLGPHVVETNATAVSKSRGPKSDKVDAFGVAVRVMSRIRSLMRSRGVQVSGTAVYCATGRSEWITRLPQAVRPAVELLYLELDALTHLRKHAEQELSTEARRHREYRILKSCPGIM